MSTDSDTRDDSSSSSLLAEAVSSLADAVFLADLDRLLVDGLIYVDTENEDDTPRFAVTAKGQMFSRGLSFKVKGRS